MATGRKLFGNRFVEFLRGPSFKYSDRQGHSLDPENSEINFAVPSIPTLLNMNSDEIPATLEPGFLHQIVDCYIKNNPDATKIEHGVSGDFKSVARSKKDNLGMVDLLGHEPKPTKSEKQGIHCDNINKIETCTSFVEFLMSNVCDLRFLSNV